MTLRTGSGDPTEEVAPSVEAEDFFVGGGARGARGCTCGPLSRGGWQHHAEAKMPR